MPQTETKLGNKSWIESLTFWAKWIFVSKKELKTINNQSLLGEGNITIEGGSGGDANVIESVKVNGTAITPDSSKAVDIQSIPAGIVSQDGTHRFVSDTEKSTWNGKQNAISDLEAIRSNASAGAAKVSNVQADWNATSGDAVILNKPKIENKDTGLGIVFGTKINGLVGEFISLTGDITISNNGNANIVLGRHDDDNNTITLTSRGSDGGIHVNTDQPFTYNNKEVATIDQIITPPVTSVNGKTGAVTVKENVQADWNATTGDTSILNKPTIPTKTSQLTNDSNFLTEDDVQRFFTGTQTISENQDIAGAKDGDIYMKTV